MSICGSDLSAQAATVRCLHIAPQALEGMVDAQAKENAKLKDAFENGNADDLTALTVKQLQTLSKEKGISIASTKADFIKLLDQAEPAIELHFIVTESQALKGHYNIRN